jgi:3-oxoacyl-[acyl-carrier protein] reductase
MRNVLVTGGSRGLGLAIVERLAEAGFRVIAVARNRTDALEAATAKAAQAGRGGVAFQSCDLSDLAAIPGMLKALRAAHGPLWGLVNNAGLGTPGVLANMPDAAIERLVRLNVISPATVSKYAVRSMMAGNDGGRIVNISSIVATTGYNGLSVYSATKAALQGFTRSLARELGPLGITVNSVAPGFLQTEMTHDLDEKQRDQIARRSALRRMAEVGDVAEAVAYLFSEQARNVTGTVLTVDAGNTA